MANRWGDSGNSDWLYFLGLQNRCRWWLQHQIKRCFLLGRKAMPNLASVLKSRDITFPTKFCIVKAMVFPVVVYGCESWTIKKAEHWRICFWALVLEKTLESPLDCQEIKPVNPKGNQPWIFIGRTDAEAKAPILWPPYAKNWLIGKDPDARKDWRQEENGLTEARWLDAITDSMDMSWSKLQEMMKNREAWCATILESQRVRHNWVTEQHNNLLLGLFVI